MVLPQTGLRADDQLNPGRDWNPSRRPPQGRLSRNGSSEPRRPEHHLPPTHDAHGDCEQLSPDDHGQHRQRAVRNSLDLQADSELDEGEDFAKGGRTAEERSANRVFSQRKYPEATDYAICSLIGGFFFLRFINPAIVTPQAYMLIDSLPTSAKHPRRTLTLVRRAVEKLRVMAC